MAEGKAITIETKSILTKDDDIPRSITSKKLNGVNYLAWAHAVKVFLRGKKKLKFLTNSPPKSDDITYDDWLSEDSVVMGWLWHSLEPHIATTVEFCDSSKKIWDSLADSFSQQSNVSRVFELYEQIFTTKQAGRPLSEYYSILKNLWDQLLQHRPFTTDVEQQKRHWEDFMIASLLSGFDSDLRGFKDQILASETLPTAANAYSRLLRSSLGSIQTAKSESSALISNDTAHGASRGNTRGRGRSSRGSARGGRSFQGRGDRKCTHCGRSNHTEPYCWVKYGKPDQVHHVSDNPAPVPSNQPEPSATTTDLAAQLSELLQTLRPSHSSASTATLANSGNITCIASTPSSWVIDSGASTHISGNSSFFSHLKSIAHHVVLADGSSRPVRGQGVLSPHSSLHLPQSLYVPNFPFNLLSVSQLTKTLHCSVTFSPTSCVFQDLKTKRTIGLGHEKDGLYYLDSAGLPSAASPVLSATVSPMQWHFRLGHPSLNKLKSVIPNLSPVSSLECEACQFGKHHRSSFSSHGVSRKPEPFDLVHTDIWGPSRFSSINGFQYFVIFVDDHSRMTWLFLMKKRSELPSIVTRFYNEIYTQFERRIKIFRSDNALEYLHSVLDSFCADRGIIHQTTCVHTSQQNGVAERKHRHLLDVARTMMFNMQVPKSFWGDAVLTACSLINRMPSTVLHNKSPFSILYPDGNPFPLTPRVFGCVAFVHVLDPGLDKLSPRSRKCIFLGYPRTQKGYRCYHPASRRYFVSADVTFFESTPFFSISGTSLSHDLISSLQGESYSASEGETGPTLPVPTFPTSLQESQENPTSQMQVYQRNSDRPVVSYGPSQSTNLSEVPITVSPTSDDDLPIAQRKGKRTCTQHPIAKFVSYHRTSPCLYSFVCALSSVSVPASYQAALSSPGWKRAMDEEMEALYKNHTWELVPLPSGKQSVGCRWVYTVKYLPDGSVERLKARLVAKGYTQTYGLDYLETFSPVARLNSVRILLAVAVTRSWPLYQLDIKNAFLHGELQEEVYMDQPPGYAVPGNEHLVCRLQRALYGLKQSPRAWFNRFSDVLLKYGLQRSTSDHSVFTQHSSSGTIVLIVYVDDIIISGDNVTGIAALKKYLSQHFHTKDLGALRYFLGIEIARSSAGIMLSQRKYVLDLLSETGLLGSRPADTPMDSSVKLDATTGSPFSDVSRYRRLVGKLIYLTVTRPDITYAVHIVSQFMHAPRSPHFEAVCRILRYLKGAPGRGLLYRSSSLSVTGYSDADWAGNRDDRRSTSGYCTFVGDNLVTWRSKKQQVVARSSAEAEYRAMAHTASEMLWVRSLLHDFGIAVPTPMAMHCDNQAAIFIASNPVFHERTKHIEVDCHFIRDLVLRKELSTPFVRSSCQLADLLTKPLPRSSFQSLSSKLGIFDLYAPA